METTKQMQSPPAEQALQKVYELLGRTKLNMNEKWMFENFYDKSEYEFLKDDQGKLQVHRIDPSKIEGLSNEELWGEDLYKVFRNHINEDGWLTSDWSDILEEKVPKLDDDYNTNPENGDTYNRMYNLEYEENQDGTMIRPLRDI